MSGGSGTAARLALACGAALLAALAGEGLVRVAGLAPAVKPIWVTDERSAYRASANPRLGFELKPNWRDDDPDLFLSYERTNSHGLRDVERSLAKPPATRRILLLGDSVVEGAGVRETETMARRLEALYAGQAVEVLNFGVSGYCTAAEIELLETRGLAFEPDAVVLVFVENDFKNFNASAFRAETAVRRPAWVKSLFLRSEAFRLASLRFDWFGFATEQDPLQRNLRALGDNNVVEGLARLARLAETARFLPVIAIWPSFDDARIFDVPAMPGTAGELVVERLAAMHGIPTYRLSAFFERDRAGRAGSPRVRYTIGDRMHPSPEGCAVAARALFEIVAAAAASVGPAGFRPRSDEDPTAVDVARELGASQRPDYGRVLTRQADALHRAGRSAEALAVYDRALAEDPSSPLAHLNLATVLLELGRREEAERHFTLAVEADRDLAAAHESLGLLAEERDDLDHAAESYREALRAQPGRASAHGRLGALRFRQGRLEDAEQELRRAAELEPGAAIPRNNLGRALEALGRTDEAAAAYADASHLDPALAEPHHNLAVLRAGQGRWREAEAEFRETLRIAPAHAKAHKNLGTLLLRSGHAAAAAEELRAAVRLAPADAEARQRLAEALDRAGAHAP